LSPVRWRDKVTAAAEHEKATLKRNAMLKRTARGQLNGPAKRTDAAHTHIFCACGPIYLLSGLAAIRGRVYIKHLLLLLLQWLIARLACKLVAVSVRGKKITKPRHEIDCN
jgi:hypothetical protein